MFATGEICPRSLKEGRGFGFVTTAQDGDLASSSLKGTGKLFNDWGFACAADSEVAYADD